MTSLECKCDGKGTQRQRRRAAIAAEVYSLLHGVINTIPRTYRTIAHVLAMLEPKSRDINSREKGVSGAARSIPFLPLPFGSPPLELPLSGLASCKVSRRPTDADVWLAAAVLAVHWHSAVWWHSAPGSVSSLLLRPAAKLVRWLGWLGVSAAHDAHRLKPTHRNITPNGAEPTAE